MFNKIYLILSIFCFISCNEKPKPFIYDYVEIAYEVNLDNNCEFTIHNIKMNSDSFYLSYFGSKNKHVALRNLDSLVLKIDNFARSLFYDSIKNININFDSNSETPPFFVFIVVKDGVKRVYKEFHCIGNRDTCGENEVIKIKSDIINIKELKNFKTQNGALKTEAIKLVLPGFY